MAKVIEGNDPLVTLGAFDPFGARPDEAHVATEHIEKLGKLIEAQLAQPASSACDSRIVFPRVNVRGFIISRCPQSHGAEFDGGKQFSFPSHTLLPEECRPPVVEPHDKN